MKLTGHTDLKTLMKHENTNEDALFEALENVGRIDDMKMIISRRKSVI